MRKGINKMKSDKTTEARALRQQAEERLKVLGTEGGERNSEADVQRMLHELQVHQIELEMQNEELQRARAEAEASAACYTDLYDFAPVGYFTLNSHGDILQSNLAGSMLLEAARSSLQNKRFSAFVAKAGRPAFNAFIEQVFAKQPDPTCEVRLEGKNGQARFVQIAATLSPDGQECRVVAMNITERKQTGEELARKTALLNETQQLTHVGGWEWDVTRQSMIWTDELYRIHGFSPDEFEPGSPKHIDRGLECYGPEERQTVKAAFELCVAEGRPYDLELPFTTADGVRKWIHTTGQAVLEKERIVRVFGNVIDITDRKEAETRVVEQKNLTDHYLRVAGIMLGVLDVSGEITLMNSKGLEMFGYSSDSELLGKNWFDTCLPIEHAKEMRGVFNQIMAGDLEPVEYYENPVLTRTGEQRLIAFNNSVLLDREGRVSGLLFSGEDITARKQSEDKRIG